MTITKREILFSVIIAFALLGLGLIINNIIIENTLLYEEKINKSLKIDNDKEKFKYAVLTNVGNVLAYGEFKAKDTVSLPELKNNYMSIHKITESPASRDVNIFLLTTVSVSLKLIRLSLCPTRVQLIPKLLA